jgi:hypothetical protein
MVLPRSCHLMGLTARTRQPSTRHPTLDLPGEEQQILVRVLAHIQLAGHGFAQPSALTPAPLTDRRWGAYRAAA